MNKKATAVALVALMTLGMVATAAAATNGGSNLEDTNTPDTNDTSQNESSDITVSVSSTTEIDVKPNSLTFTGLNIGTQTTKETSGESPRFGSFTIDNIGSEYIDRVWASATHPTSDPFGTGDPSAYDAGNFLQIKPSDASSTAVRGNDTVYHYVNRYEFANSWSSSRGEIPSYIRADPGTVLSSGTAKDTYVGRLQAGNEWYFYTIVTGSTNDVCDGSGNAKLRIGQSVHSSSKFGTVDFRATASDYSNYTIKETSGSYGLTGSKVKLNYTVGGSTVTRKYDLLTRCTPGATISQPHVIRTRYNVQAGDVADLTAGTDANASQTQFLLSTGSSSSMLKPGQQLVIDAAIEVPQGVPTGQVQAGQLTFYVTSDYTAGPES
ncbi:MAG: hypothetical protein ABEK00_03175 [Candidatus Nanohaloarchaea archaeon]